MIIDLNQFILRERPFWSELETALTRIEKDPQRKMSLASIQRFHYLYQRASAGFSKIKTYSSEREISLYLESLIARAFAHIHSIEKSHRRFSPMTWFFTTFPVTFRKHIRLFAFSVLLFTLGGIFGALAITYDYDAKKVLMPFSHLEGSPKDRVKSEEAIKKEDRLKGRKSTFSSSLMTHNTKVSILALALGMTFGIGTLILLFYNGVILGAVAMDYILHGETLFLFGWLLPHGAIEIPAILIGGQAGFVLASALMGWGKPVSMKNRLKKAGPDLLTLIGGVAVLLVWAGIIEAFLSQYHEPVIPYAAKIAFGITEMVLFTFYLIQSGKKRKDDPISGV